jgi:O-acetylserine/cysteine efflux transporter
MARAYSPPQTDRVPLRDRLLALLVAICWGVNFPATTLALQHFPPLLMVALRFILIAIPTMIFVRWPKVPARWLIGVGLGIGTMQFALLYVAMSIGMPAGLASIVLQASAVFTVLLGAVFLRERLSGRQVVGFVLAVAGLVVIAVHRSQVAALVPLLLTLGAALGWAIGNICSRQARAPKPLHLTLWMSVVAPLPLLALSLLFEGPAQGLGRAADHSDLGRVALITRPALHRDHRDADRYGLWNTLLSRHPSNVVAPFAMLVPVTGVLSAWMFLGEVPNVVELVAGALVVGGVLYGSRVSRATRRAAMSEIES